MAWPLVFTGVVQVAVKIVKRAGLPEDDEKALKDEVWYGTVLYCTVLYCT